MLLQVWGDTDENKAPVVQKCQQDARMVCSNT